MLNKINLIKKVGLIIKSNSFILFYIVLPIMMLIITEMVIKNFTKTTIIEPVELIVNASNFDYDPILGW